MRIELDQNGDLPVSQMIRTQLIAEAGRAGCNECCGLILGREGWIEILQPATNTHLTPQTHFEIDPQALIDAHRIEREGGLEIFGYYHSHPAGTPHPSLTDRARASGDGRIWAIVAKAEIMFWRDMPQGFEPLSHLVGEL